MDRTAFDQLFDLSDRTVIVTGGTRGIGLALAEGFVLAGARVVVVGAVVPVTEVPGFAPSASGSCVGVTAVVVGVAEVTVGATVELGTGAGDVVSTGVGGT